MELAIPFRVASWARVDLEDLRAEDINVEDIACALSNICRFTGHVRDFYSVAQHATMVAELVHPTLRFAALHHDDSEAYLGDVSRHLKHSHYLSGYRTLEERATATIEAVLGIRLTREERDEIKAADDCVAVFEQYVLRQNLPWRGDRHTRAAIQEGFISPGNAGLVGAMAGRVPASWHPFIPLLPSQARKLYLKRHEEWS